ncbi:UNVERIFIED_CONTAM: 26S proteasome regulatory subunitB [Sesamum calycinum]|uniref:26S proteasome regulatory subunitB n=1 Tax=Sesamum calycinum TaxID=2727403 RepID=A0AAW2J320_9LAMI
MGLVCRFALLKMNLSDELDLEDYVSQPYKISAAEIAAICQEAGMLAVRKICNVILPKISRSVTDPMCRNLTLISSSTSDDLLNQ